MTAVEVANKATYSFTEKGDLIVKGGAIIFKNFNGGPTKFNPNGGKRSFALVMPQYVADRLVDEGWNVKHRPPREEGDDDLYYTEIVVKFDGKTPPELYLVTQYGKKKNKVKLDEETVGLLDTTVIVDLDMVIHPWHHGLVNSSGATVKGYVHELYATARPVIDYFGGKYDEFDETE